MSSFDDIRKWFGHYGAGGAGQTAWDLDDIKVRRLSQKATGANSLGDVRPGGVNSRRIASMQRQSISTSASARNPRNIHIELMDSPGSPMYQEQDESYAFGDPWGKEYWARVVSSPGGTAVSRAVFAGCHFYYNDSRSLRVSLDYVARPQINTKGEGGASVVIVEYQSGYASGASKVLHSFTETVNSRNIKKFETTVAVDKAKPYKLVSIQIASPRDIATNQYSLFHVANMIVEET
ncbi:hypothetical protein N9L28_05810 [Luminiphilus sp.]|nr:hypothetical protein [Luminiphilus sp.]